MEREILTEIYVALERLQQRRRSMARLLLRQTTRN